MRNEMLDDKTRQQASTVILDFHKSAKNKTLTIGTEVFGKYLAFMKIMTG